VAERPDIPRESAQFGDFEDIDRASAKKARIRISARL
jgi:hypothetical protein